MAAPLRPPPAQAPLASGMRPVRSRRAFPTLRGVTALMLREMASTYGRSPGGYVWAVLEPLGAIALLTIIFSLGFRAPPIGTNFAIFYATGILPFILFSDLSSVVGSSVNFSRALLAYPSVTYLDAIMARALLSFLTRTVVSVGLVAGILLLYETRTTLDLARVFQAWGLMALLGLSVGILNCFLWTMVPLWQRLWTIITRPLFIVSCIFFTFETVPAELRPYLWWNPLVHPIGIMRSGVYASYDAPYASPLYIVLLSLPCLLAGLLFLNRYNRDLLTR